LSIIGGLINIEKVDRQYPGVFAANLLEEEIGTAVKDTDLGDPAFKLVDFLLLQESKEHQGIRRIDISLDRPEITKDEFPNG
jgi:hypothetical protein